MVAADPVRKKSVDAGDGTKDGCEHPARHDEPIRHTADDRDRAATSCAVIRPGRPKDYRFEAERLNRRRILPGFPCMPTQHGRPASRWCRALDVF